MWNRVFHPVPQSMVKMLFGGERVCLPLLTQADCCSACQLPGAVKEVKAFKGHKLNEPLKCRQEFTQR